MKYGVLALKRRQVHATVKAPVELGALLPKGNHSIGNAQCVSNQRFVESVDECTVETSPAKPAAPLRTALRDATGILYERQLAQDFGPLRMTECDNPAARVGFFDRAHRGSSEQRIADPRNVNEQNRRAADRHQTLLRRFAV